MSGFLYRRKGAGLATAAGAVAESKRIEASATADAFRGGSARRGSPWRERQLPFPTFWSDRNVDS